MTETELAKIITKNESTVELGQYWAKRYEKFLADKFFVVSDKTLSLVNSQSEITSPATPFGHIDLTKFVSKNRAVDEIALQNTIETAVRFLDSTLDSIPFTNEASNIINQFRKIGVGVMSFDKYLEMRGSSSEIDEIDYIGNLISSSSYRASEALGEEKGLCQKWDSVKMLLKPKVFEYWFNTNTGEIKNGLDISEEFAADSITTSHFEIIPRRNTNILLYPSDLEWQIWSDRDELVSKEDKITSFKKESQAAQSTDLQNSKETKEEKHAPNPINSWIDQGVKKLSSWFGANVDEEKTETETSSIASKIYTEEDIKDSPIKQATQIKSDIQSVTMPTLDMVKDSINSKVKAAEEQLQTMLSSDPATQESIDKSKEGFTKVKEEMGEESSKSSFQIIKSAVSTVAPLSSVIGSSPAIVSQEAVKSVLNNAAISKPDLEVESKDASADQPSKIEKVIEPIAESETQSTQVTVDPKSNITSQAKVESEKQTEEIKSPTVITTSKPEAEEKLNFADQIKLAKGEPVKVDYGITKTNLQAIVLSDDGGYVLVERENSQLPQGQYHWETDPEKELTRILALSYKLNVDYIEVGDINLDKNTLHVCYHVRLSDTDKLNSMKWISVSEVQDRVSRLAVNQVIDKIRRWQDSSKTKATKIAEDMVALEISKVTAKHDAEKSQIKNDHATLIEKEVETQKRSLSNDHSKQVREMELQIKSLESLIKAKEDAEHKARLEKESEIQKTQDDKIAVVAQRYEKKPDLENEKLGINKASNLVPSSPLNPFSDQSKSNLGAFSQNIQMSPKPTEATNDTNSSSSVSSSNQNEDETLAMLLKIKKSSSK
jgi:hypothetical protein